MKEIAIASDHAGFKLKEFIKDFLESENYKVLDLGTDSEESVDYPDFGKKLGKEVIAKKIQGIAICGTGIGITIAANKIKNIRAANCLNEEMAILAREHNDANILGLGARLLEKEKAKKILNAFLNTGFEGGRHQRRVNKIG